MRLFFKRIYRVLMVLALTLRPKHELCKRFPGVSFSQPENIEIHDRVSFGAHVILLATSPIKIGSDTMIASRVIINTSTHNYDNHPMWKEQVCRPIEIGKHVWIGTNATLLPGVKIGDYAVIGAGTVVNRHVPDWAIVAGNPPRIIKFREKRDEDLSVEYPGRVVYNEFLPARFTTKKKQDGD